VRIGDDHQKSDTCLGVAVCSVVETVLLVGSGNGKLMSVEVMEVGRDQQ